MFKRVAHLFGFGKKDEAVEKRFAKIKARYGASTLREDVDPVSHVRTGLETRHVVGPAPKTMEEVRASFLQTYADSRGESMVSTTPELAHTRN